MRLRTQELVQRQLAAKGCLRSFPDIAYCYWNGLGNWSPAEDLHQALWSAAPLLILTTTQPMPSAIRDVLNDSVDAPLYIETLPAPRLSFIGQKE